MNMTAFDRKRPVATLFMLMTVDGKISTGATDAMDVDADFPKIAGVKEGLHQYYGLEQETDLWSLNSGKTQAKIGVNANAFVEQTTVSFAVIDNQHLTARGVEYLRRKTKNLVIATTVKNHPAGDVEGVHMIYFDTLDPKLLLEALWERHGCERITIQTGGTLNEMFLRAKLLDYVDIVVAPVLVGGKHTSSLIDGHSLQTPEELNKLGVLKLEKCEALNDSYVRLRYKVIS
jgi:2,5-diamino-6-(ribosylamino)-4(3H)-pyrimidinone 5'-phosphate reductase